MSALPRYVGWDEVPDGLQPANDLRFSGLEPRGGPAAIVVVGDREIELFQRVDAAPRERPSPARGRGSIDPATSETPGAPGTGTGRRAAKRGGAVALPARSGLLAELRRSDADPATAGVTARRWLRELLLDDFVVLDTETTGLGYEAEVIEIGVVAPDGARLLESFVRPRAGSVPPLATRIHGLTMADLEGAPSWPEVYDRLLEVTDGRRVLAWNAAFDERMVRQTSRIWSLPRRVPRFECAMQAYALCSGSRFGRAKLERAAATLGLLGTGRQRHRSCDDALLTLQVLMRTAAGAG